MAVTMEALMKEIKENRETIENRFKESNTNVKNQFDELYNKMGHLHTRLDKLEHRLGNVEKSGSLCQDELDQVKGELNTVKQKELELNLIVKGIPERTNETQEQLESIFEQLMVNIQLPNIGQPQSIKRIGKIRQGKPRLVLVVTSSKEQKMKIIAAKRKHKITAKQISIDGTMIGDDTQNIYIDEHVTRYTSFLLKRCRDFRSEFNVKYVWVTNGIVYIKRDDNSQPTLIRSEYDIDRYRATQTKKNKRPADHMTYDSADEDSESSLPKRPLTRSQSFQYQTARATFQRAVITQQPKGHQRNGNKNVTKNSKLGNNNKNSNEEADK